MTKNEDGSMEMSLDQAIFLVSAAGFELAVSAAPDSDYTVVKARFKDDILEAFEMKAIDESTLAMALITACMIYRRMRLHGEGGDENE